MGSQPARDLPRHDGATSGFTLAQMQRARREAREMILAFLAGAQFVADAAATRSARPRRRGGYTAGDILYVGRTRDPGRVHAGDARRGRPAPGGAAGGHGVEDGVRALSRRAARPHEPDQRARRGEPGDARLVIRAGFGLRNPDRDGEQHVVGTVQGRVFYANDAARMKPVMSVLYAGTNMALHAFRAGPSVPRPRIATACGEIARRVRFAGRDCGGEELWAFVPYDQLGKLTTATSTTRRSATRTTT